MVTIRVRFENGNLIPLDDIPEFAEGDEFEVELTPEPSDEDIDAMLDATRGMWADIADEVERHIKEARQEWDKEWQGRLSSL